MPTLKMGSTTVLTDTTLANAVQDNVTRLGTVTSGTISTGATIATGVHGKYVLKDYDDFHYNSSTSFSSYTGGATWDSATTNISGSNYLTVTTGTSTSDLLILNASYVTERASNYIGHVFERATATDFSAGKVIVWGSGYHSIGSGSNTGDEYETHFPRVSGTVADYGLSASTTYYFRAIAALHPNTGTRVFGVLPGGVNHGSMGASLGTAGGGVRMNFQLWTLVP
jgi:hypothetical protein